VVQILVVLHYIEDSCFIVAVAVAVVAVAVVIYYYIGYHMTVEV